MKFIIFSILLLLATNFRFTKQNTTVVNSGCVAFRLDDIQDWWITEAQRKVMSIFESNALPLTIGIIANYYGTDKNIVDFVKANIHSKAYCLEISDHGWNHEDFSSLSLNEQTDLLNKSINKIAEYTGIYPTTFIPPFNAFDSNTIRALLATGFTYMTSQDKLDPPPHPNNAPIYRYPIDAATSDPASSLYYAYPADVVMKQIQNQLNNDGYSAVMMHPQDFSVKKNGGFGPEVNTTEIGYLEELITLVKRAGLKVVPVNQLQLCVKGTYPSPCVHGRSNFQ